MTTQTLTPVYGSAVALTTTHLQSLAYGGSGSSAIWQSAYVDNTSNLSLDEIIAVTIKTGTSLSNPYSTGLNYGIEMFAYEAMDDSPTFSTNIDGTEKATVVNTEAERMCYLKFAGRFSVDTTNNRIYQATFRLSRLFGFSLPKYWGLMINNVTGVALASSGNSVVRIPVQMQFA
jgi:hypothetical protein